MKKSEKKQISTALVQSALADDFGIEAENITRIIEKGDNSDAFSAEYDGQKIIIKTIKDDSGIYPIEIKVLELLHEHGIPVAKPLGYTAKAKHLGQPILIQSAVLGVSLDRSSAYRSPGLYKAIGEMLKKIHQIHLQGYGKLEIKDGELRGRESTWKEGLLNSNPNGVPYGEVAYLQKHGFIDSVEAKKIEHVFAKILEVDLPKASLLHNDVQTVHVFTDGKKITGLIDMGGVSAGDPRFDIAKAHYYFYQEFWPAFDEGYGELTQDPLVDDYFLLNAARKVIYRHKYSYYDRIPEAIETLKGCLSKR